MPTYDYRCDTCGVAFEVFQSFSEDALKKCPNKKSGNSPAGCSAPGRGRVTKVFSAPGIAFKGSGFYKTDSRSSSAGSATSDSSSESSTTSASDTTTSKSSDSKSSDSKSSDSKSSDSKSSSGSSASSTTTKTD